MSDLPTRPAVRILRAEHADQWIDGYAFVQAARDEAAAIRQNSEQWLEQARAAGFESARRRGAEQVSTLLSETSARVDVYLAGLEASLADVALSIVRELIDELDDAERVVRCARKALSAFRQDHALTLFVPRQEVEALRNRVNAEGDGLPAIAVEFDDQLQPGQARLSSPAGSVELGLEAQLQTLRRSLVPSTGEPSA